jgi:aromatic ring hydroxylase
MENTKKKAKKKDPLSLDSLMPSQADKENGEIRKRWKRYFQGRPQEQLVGVI